MQIELPGLVMQGVDQQGPHPDEFGGLDGARDRIPQQMGTQASALFLDIDGEAAQQDDGNRIWHALSDSSAGVQSLDGACGQGVVADDPSVPAGDEAPGGSCRLVAQGTSTQPIVQGGFTTVEG
jgi:hypothetical protein